MTAAPASAGSPNVLVLGATGMLGHAVFQAMANGTVTGTVRKAEARALFMPTLAARLVEVENLENPTALQQLFETIRPDVVVNCAAVGRPTPSDPMRSVAIYSVLPQQLSQLCRHYGARLVQISSDGVFSGQRGHYGEDDLPDATDVYGVAKRLGEVTGPHAITLRTSIIGHELQGRSGLLEWFLSQHDRCRCYTRAMYSGLPTVVLARLIRDVVIRRPDLSGIYHVASRPISKFDLLALVAARYGKLIELVPDDQTIIDRSLVADRFAKATGLVLPDWPELIDAMYVDRFGAKTDPERLDPRGYDVQR
jgi:dTDP-4-dehydrorhamnose reductase